MRIVLRSKPVALFAALFALALIVLLPLRLVAGWLGLGDAGLTAREVRGSVWAGAMDDAGFDGLALGDLHARLSPFPLLVGKGRVEVARQGGSDLHGAVTVSRHGLGIDDVAATLAGGSAFGALPVSQLDLTDVSAHFADGRCVMAEGRVRAAMAGDIAGVDLAGGMSGTARCDGEALLLPLVSPAGTERVMLKISGSGRYRADLAVQPPDAAAVQRLTLAGFRPTGQGYVLSVEGTFHRS